MHSLVDLLTFPVIAKSRTLILEDDSATGAGFKLGFKKPGITALSRVFQEIQKLLNKQPSFPNSKRNINASFHPQVLNTIEALLYHLNNDKICNHYFIETLECLTASIILA